MNFQVCYVLVCGPNDAYAEMALISSNMLRSIYPDIKVTLLTDTESQKFLVGRNTEILDDADKVVCLQTQHEHYATRSRYLKTQMRQMVEGNFLYLDVDAIPVRAFDSIAEPSNRCAAVLDRQITKPRPEFPTWVHPIYDELKWRRPLPRYFNGGVIYFPDTPQSHSLGEEWHRRWQQTLAIGEYRDQLSLNSAIDALDIDVRVLPHRYNAMIEVTPWVVLERPKILHFFASNALPAKGTLFHQLLKRVQQGEKVDWKAERELWVSKGPWLDTEKSIKLNFITGRYGVAARQLTKRLMRI